MLHFQTGTVVGRKEDSHWAQVIKAPHGYGVIEYEDPEGHAQKVGIEITRAIMEVLREQTSVADIFSFIEKLPQPGIQTLLLCIPQGRTVTVILRGEGACFLKRDGKLAKLRSRQGTISGETKPGDTLFLASRTCVEGITESELPAFFDHLTAEEVGEKLAFALRQKSELAGYAGLFLEVIGEEGQQPDSGYVKPAQAMYTQNQIRSWWRARTKLSSALVRAYRKMRELDIRVTVALAIFFVMMLVIGISREIQQKHNTNIQGQIQEMTRMYEEGAALLDLNTVKSRERFMSAQTLLLTLKKDVSPKSKEGREIAEIEKKIAELLPKATQKYEVTPELFYDVSLLKGGSTISAFAFSGETMVFLDRQTSSLFSLVLATKNGQILAGSSAIAGATEIALHGDNAFVLVPEGITGVSTKDKSVKALIKKSDEWGKVSVLSAYGGNLYALDSVKSRIWKYVATGSAELSGLKFSDMKEYLNADTLPDLSAATTISIDGSIWLGTTTGKIIRFTQGKEDSISIRGVEPEFGNMLLLYADDTAENLYILDGDNTRVVVLEKDGLYKAQYQYPKEMKPTGIAVSEQLGNVFLFIDGKLYTFSLQK